jgi:hypothetical protein
MTTALRKRRTQEDWGQLSAEMRALPNDQWRAFCHALVADRARRPHGRYSRALRASGLAKNSTPANVAKLAWKIAHDERMIAAVAVESRRLLRAGHPEAVNTLYAIMRDPTHRDRARVAMAFVDRADPIVTKQDISVTHRHIDPDQEALEELRALRHLGTPREKLLALFGHNGLDRIEALEAADTSRRADAAKVIEGKVVEMDAAE